MRRRGAGGMSPGERRGGPGQETASLEIADTASVTPGLAAEPKMSVRERDELKTLVNERARLEIDRVKSLAAERFLVLNRQLEAQWEAEDFAVGELMKALEVMAAAANEKVKARCDELGILPELSPRVVTGFGRCGVRQTRRALLRQLVKDENEAALRKAVHRINTWKFETRT